MTVPNEMLPWAANGDFTLYKFVAKLNAEELERQLGFHPGRLDRGAVVAIMFKPDLNALTPSDFALGASTRWSRSSAAAPWAPEFARIGGGANGIVQMEPNAIESALALRGQDPQKLKQKVISFFKTADGNTPAKVFPTWRPEDWMEYPDAEAGVPQFRLHNKVKWVVMRVLGAK